MPSDLWTSVDLDPQPIGSLKGFVDDLHFHAFERAVRDAAARLDGRTVWHINSTAEGGGVAEMLRALLPYLLGAGWDVRWIVMEAEEDFFEVTKGLHHALHGMPPADNIWSEIDSVYLRTTHASAAALRELTRPGDVAMIHDPQCAGLVTALAQAGVSSSWQCHIGTDAPNELTRRAWDVLCPLIEPAGRYVFSRRAYLWEGLDEDRLCVIPPAIDASTPKNATLTDDEVRDVLIGAGIFAGETTTKRVEHKVHRVGGDRPIDPDAKVVLQVSRWDRLKDPIGIIRMFADHLSDIGNLHVLYAGPATSGVDDDPEGATVFAACEEFWRSLSPDTQDRLHLLSIPMDDVDENALIVNALQCRADVVVQKSIEEGFGLTVAEAMWKGRPVVASRVGGIQDQIEHGRNGLLVDDPHDVAAFAAAVRELIHDPACAERIGEAAHTHVQREFLSPRILRQYAELACDLVDRTPDTCS
jgi:trehalose synthase